jgi:acetyl esterase/lipase
MPATLILTAEHDLFTEQSEAYGKRLTEEGVAVVVRRYPGHGLPPLKWSSLRYDFHQEDMINGKDASYS